MIQVGDLVCLNQNNFGFIILYDGPYYHGAVVYKASEKKFTFEVLTYLGYKEIGNQMPQHIFLYDNKIWYAAGFNVFEPRELEAWFKKVECQKT